MIRTIDRGITAAYQLLVNLSGRKPMWWGEQCTYLVFLALLMGLFAESPLFRWLHYLLTATMAICVLAMWACTRVPELWSSHVRKASWVYRFLFTFFFADQVLFASFAGTFRLHICLLSMALMSFEYFLLCKDPPPPRPRHRPAMEGSEA